jgi:hypothetical protein
VIIEHGPELTAVESTGDLGRRSDKRWRLPRVIAACGVAIFAAYLAVTAVYFVDPSRGTVRNPQAVIVLNGYGNRLGRGVAIARTDHVHTVVVSVPSEANCPQPIHGLRVMCFEPNPASTQGEARSLAKMADHYGWSRLLMVVGTTQLTRARLRIERCYAGQIALTGVDPQGFLGWVHYVAYDEAAMVKALIWQRGC